MNGPPLEQRLRRISEVVVLPARSVRHLIKRHRQVKGVVPHDHCYALGTAELLALLRPDGIEFQPRYGAEWSIVLAAPSPLQTKRLGQMEVYRRELRLGLHASIHLAFAQLEREGRLDEAELAGRLRQMGRAEFEEIKSALARDDRLFAPGDDREVYVEFAATYLELSAFAPELLPTVFPGLTQLELIDEMLARDVDVARLAAVFEVPGAADHLGEPMRRDASWTTSRLSWATPHSSRAAPQSAPASVPPGSGGHQRGPADAALVLAEARAKLRAPWPLMERHWFSLARRAAARERYARAALLSVRVTLSSHPQRRARAEALLGDALRELEFRLLPYLSKGGVAPAAKWSDPLLLLVLGAAAWRGWGGGPQARVLGLLDRAASIARWPGYRLRMNFRWQARARRLVLRQSDANRSVKVARLLALAAEQAEAMASTGAQARVVLPVLRSAAERSHEQARGLLGRRLAGVLRWAGLVPRSGLEQLSQQRLIDELVDRTLARGFISLPQLRDAVSRNDLKLPDVTLVGRGRKRDPLLAADALSSRMLLGVYRRGDIYLRALQKASSLPFGTPLGRIVFMYFVLPLVGAFVLIEGAVHLANPPLGWLGFEPLPPPGAAQFVVLMLVLLGLLHSRTLRKIARQIFDLVGMVLAWLLYRIPRALIAQPAIQRLLAQPAVRFVVRQAVTPAVMAAIAYGVSSWWLPDPLLCGVIAAGAFLITSWWMASRLSFWLEGVFIEQLAPTWRALGQRWLPEVLRLVGRTFAVLVDAMERAMARVDDSLRARHRPRKVGLWALVLVSVAWGVLSYVVRLYVTLLVEPELNPLKHFPVVTVAHKLLLPFLPTLLEWVEPVFSVLGPLLGGALSGLTVFLLPSMFGFLVWELKENYRLYAATRAREIQPSRFGPHGETLRELLVVGLHSGTLPKLYERLRHAAEQRDARRHRTRSNAAARLPFSSDPELRRFRVKLENVRIAIRRFVERELLPSITKHPDWQAGRLSVARVEVSSNRVRVQIACRSLGEQPLELTIEQLGGHLVAGCSRPGYLPRLGPSQALLFDNALAVFYHRAHVDLVREQLAATMPGEYRVDSEGIRVSVPDSSVVLSYPIDVRWPRQLKPRVSGGRMKAPPRLDARAYLYAHQPVLWDAWQATWQVGASKSEPTPLLHGASLLPRPAENRRIV